MAVIRLSEHKMKSLGERGIHCIFIGYVDHSNAYKFFVLKYNNYVSVNTVMQSRDVIFNEITFHLHLI